MNRGLAYSLTAIVTGFFAIFFLYPAVIVLKEAFYVKEEGLTFGFIREVFANPVMLKDFGMPLLSELQAPWEAY